MSGTWSGPNTPTPANDYYGGVQHTNGVMLSVKLEAVGEPDTNAQAAFAEAIDALIASGNFTLLQATRYLSSQDTYTP